ncbi:MAG: type II secretion system protein N [Oleiphilus sp.]
MIKKVILYFFIFVISLLVSLIMLMPANFLWERVVSPQINIKKIGLDVEKVAGTVWDGKALLRYQNISGIMAWEIEASKVLSLSLPIRLSLNSQIGEIKAHAKASLSKFELGISSAEVELKPLTPILRAQRVSLDGRLIVKDLAVVLEDQRVVSATGMASWSGGDIAYPAGREVHERTLPMFKALLQTKEKGSVHLGIRDAQATFDVIDASLSESGEGLVKITRRLLDLSNEPWSLNSREQDVVFKVKKTLY